MIDDIGFPVSDLEAAKSFYTRALAPLGFAIVMEVMEEMTEGHGAHIGMGRAGEPVFWFGTGKPAASGLHVALAAPDRVTVDRFYDAAIAARGKDNGAPGLRPIYHEHYYGAFVFDLDGNNIEAVCHAPA